MIFSSIPVIAEYFRMKESRIVVVVIISIRVASLIVWKIPASWSVWQLVRIMASICNFVIPIFLSRCRAKTGGSTKIAFSLIQIIKPDAQPSKSMEDPREVIPNYGKVKWSSLIFSTISLVSLISFCFWAFVFIWVELTSLIKSSSYFSIFALTELENFPRSFFSFGGYSS